jgi:transposase
VPIPYPKEFRADVVAVARQGDKSRAQVARSFGISESCLTRWLQIADRDDGTTASSSSKPTEVDLEAENRELRRRTKQLEQENEILRRATAYFARDTLPK